MEDQQIGDRLDAIEARLTALEAASIETAEPARMAEPPDGDDAFWVLDGLRSRFGGTGAVTFAGSVTIPDGPVEWQIGATTDQVMSQDWSRSAADLAALGHPVRLTLLQAVLGGAHTVAELASIDGMGSTGQLYHHLGQLSAHGWLTTTGRGSYVVPATRVVPLMVIMTATPRLP